MSDYQKLMAELKERRCKPCGGLGTQNDADCNDISHRTWVCPCCKGSGLADGQTA